MSNCLQLVCSSDSPVNVTPVSSPVAPSLQGLDETSACKLSAKNVGHSTDDWERCAKEFVGNSELKTVRVSGKQWRKTLPLLQGTRHQPKAKKRLASTIASEVVPSDLAG